MFSVIVPVYNGGEYLSRCLQSFVGQTSKDFELICINDGSEDNTDEILEGFKAKIETLKILKNEKNSGVSYSRKRGIDCATSEYVTFVDGDDYVSADYAATINEEIAGLDDQTMFICFNHIVEYKGRRTVAKSIKNDSLETDFAMLVMNRKGEISNYLCDKVFRKSYLSEIVPPSNMIIGEDYYILSHYLLRHPGKIQYCGKAIYHYVIRKESVSHRSFSEQFVSTYENYKSLKDFLCEAKPQLTPYFIYFFLFESSLLVSRTKRNSETAKNFISTLRKEIKEEYHAIKQCEGISFASKMCIRLLKTNYSLFKAVFSIYKIFN